MSSFFGYAMPATPDATQHSYVQWWYPLMCLQEAAKPEEDEEVVIKDQEANFAVVHSPVKSYASDDSLDDWI